MPRKSFTAEQIIAKLRLIEVAMGSGKSAQLARKEAQVVIERWRRHYNTQRPHSLLGYRQPAPAAHWAEPVFSPQPDNMQ